MLEADQYEIDEHPARYHTAGQLLVYVFHNG